LLDAIQGDTVLVHQDLRDTQGDSFYWYFRVRGATGRTLTFQFTQGNVIGVRGPALSTDHGKTWKWLGKAAVSDTSFQYTFPRDVKEVRFCFTMPYVESNLREFLSRYTGNSHLRAGVLCKTRKGRDVACRFVEGSLLRYHRKGFRANVCFRRGFLPSPGSNCYRDPSTPSVV